MDSRTTTRNKLSGFHRHVRRAATFLLIVSALGLFLYIQLVHHVDQEILRFIQTKITAQYPHLRVRVQEARRIEGHGILLRGLSLIDPGNKNSTVVEVDKMFVHCTASIPDLATGNTDPSKITIEGVTVFAIREPGGPWSLETMRPLPKCGDSSPVVEIREARLHIHDRSRPQSRPVNFELDTLQLNPVLPSPQTNGQRLTMFNGTLHGDHIEQVAFRGRFWPETQRWLIDGKLEGLQVAPRLVESLPAEIAKPLESVTSVQARVNANFRASNEHSDKPTFVVDGTIDGGTVVDPRLPFPITNITSHFHVNQDVAKLDRIDARSGSTRYQVQSFAISLKNHRIWDATGSVYQLPLSEPVARSLPAKLRENWDKFSPTGLVDIEFQLASNQERVIPRARVRCQDVSVSFFRFPYRVEQGSGTILVDDRNISAENLQVMANGKVMDCDFQVINEGEEDNPFWFTFKSQKPIAIDQQLAYAIRQNNAKAYKVFQSLQATGELQVEGRFQRERIGGAVKKQISMQLFDVSMKYDKFRYPIYQIRGGVEIRDDQWFIKELNGRNDSAYITCDGSWRSDPQHGHILSLKFDAQDVPLEDELRNALKPEIQQVWSKLVPRGTLDTLHVDLSFLANTKKLSVEVDASKRRSQSDIEGRSLSIEPTWFPLRFGDVVGRFQFKDGTLRFTNVHARHNRAVISLSGECRTRDGFWNLRLQDVAATDVRLDRAIVRAFPPALQSSLARMNLSGPLSVAGELEFDGGPMQPVSSRWNLDVDVEDGRINSGIAFEHIRGSVNLNGTHTKANGLQCHGQLGIDSMMHNDLLLTWVRGPFQIQDREIKFGSVATIAGRPQKRVTANTLGGTLSLDAILKLEGNNPFALHLILSGGQLDEIVQEYSSGGKQRLSGNVYATLGLQGNNTGSESWFGDGFVNLSNADIYELPLIVALLTPLRARPLDRTAFTDCNIRYRLVGDKLYFNPIVLTGDALTLRGVGDMKLDRTIDLRFYTQVGRDEQYLPVLHPLFGEASRQILEIQLGGTIDKPEFTRKAFPKFNETLQQLFPELARPPTLQDMR